MLVSEEEYEIGEAEEQVGASVIVSDKVERLRKVLKDIIPRSKWKTIDYIVDMFTSNPVYQTPTGLYHLLSIFKLDPNQIRLVVEYVFGPGSLDMLTGMPNPGVSAAYPAMPQMMYVPTPFGMMPIILNVPVPQQKPVLVKRKRPVLGPDGKPLRDEKGNIIYEEVVEPVGQSQPTVMPMMGVPNPVELLRAYREMARDETEPLRKQLEKLLEENKELRMELEKERREFMKMINDLQMKFTQELLKREQELRLKEMEYRKEIEKLKAEFEKERLAERIEGMKASFQHQLEDLKRELKWAERLRRLEESMSLSERAKYRMVETLDAGFRSFLNEATKTLAVLRESWLKQQVATRMEAVPEVSEEIKDEVVKRIRMKLGAGSGEQQQQPKPRQEAKQESRPKPPVEVRFRVVEAGET